MAANGAKSAKPRRQATGPSPTEVQAGATQTQPLAQRAQIDGEIGKTTTNHKATQPPKRTIRDAVSLIRSCSFWLCAEGEAPAGSKGCVSTPCPADIPAGSTAEVAFVGPSGIAIIVKARDARREGRPALRWLAGGRITLKARRSSVDPAFVSILVSLSRLSTCTRRCPPFRDDGCCAKQHGCY